MDNNIYTLKQAIMKIDSFLQDVCDLKDDDADNRDTLEIIADTASIVEAKLINIYKDKTGEDDPLYEVEMEEIDEFPFDNNIDYSSIDILDESVL